MTDVFISYAREDRARVQPLADALAARGLVVWWDPELRAGRDFRTEIGEALSTAKAMIVAWSRFSTASRFVRDEADEGAAREILFPVLLDLVDVPLGFRQAHTLDLTNWHGDPGYPPCEALIETVASFIASRTPAAEPAKPIRAPHSELGMLPFAITGVLARSRLFVRSLVLSGVAAGIALIIWSFVMLTSANMTECPHGISGLLACSFYWSRALLTGAAAFLLTLIARSLTFWADGIFGARSLNLFSRSFATTVLAAALLAAPSELELQFSSFALLRPFKNVVFSTDSRKIFASSGDGIVVWDIQTGARKNLLKWPSASDDPHPAPTGEPHMFGTIQIEGITDPPPNALNPADCTPDAAVHSCGVIFVSPSPDGTHFVTASLDGVARVWDSTGAQTLTLQGVHRDKIYVARFSPNGRMIATTSADRTIAIWGTKRGRLMQRFSLATPMIGKGAPDPVPLLQSGPMAKGVPRYSLETLPISSIILRGLGVLSFVVLLGAALKVALANVIRPQFQQWMMLCVMTAAALSVAWVYATNLPAEGLLFWLGYAALLTPIVALLRLTLAGLMRPAFARAA